MRGHAGSCLATRDGVCDLCFSAREQPPGTAFVAVRRDAVVGIATGGSLLCSAPLCRTGSIAQPPGGRKPDRSEEHTSELQSLMRISYAVFCLKKKKKKHKY